MRNKRQQRALRLINETFPDLTSVGERVLAEVESVDPDKAFDLEHLSTIRSRQAPAVKARQVHDLVRALPLAIVKAAADEPVSDDELTAMEAVVTLYGRPALLVQDDDFGQPPTSWAMLAFKRAEIQAVLPSVGRIEFSIPGLKHIGTGFLVGERLVMTNRHVAASFAREENGTWAFLPYISTQIDYKEEKGVTEAAEFRIEQVLGVHAVYDLALLRIAPTSAQGTPLPPPLRIMAQAPAELDGAYVYIVGYPAKDAKRNDPEALEQVFENVFNCKRLQPGRLRGLGRAEHAGAPDADVLLHDCSTLGGNSGSCLVDLGTGQVIGLHYGGYYGKENFAVPLWLLAGDPFLEEHGVPDGFWAGD